MGLLHTLQQEVLILKLSDNFFKKVEKKTNVDKNTILSLAEKLQDDNMKNETALRDVIKQISILTGKEVPKEKEDKIINTIMQDKVPDNLDDYIKVVKKQNLGLKARQKLLLQNAKRKRLHRRMM